MDTITVKIYRIDSSSSDIDLPGYATPGSAGMDIRAAVREDVVLQPGRAELIPTGFIIELPEGFEAQIRPRSGLAIKHRVGILNAPGTIDSDYRGEVKIIMMNYGDEPFTVRRGDRIAQMIISSFVRVSWDVVGTVRGTERGAGGFGHTGNK